MAAMQRISGNPALRPARGAPATAAGRRWRPEMWLTTMRHIGEEDRVFVHHPASDPTAPGDEPETMMATGGSCIVGPLGDVIAEPCRDREAIIAADLDLRELLRARDDFDAVGRSVGMRTVSARTGGGGPLRATIRVSCAARLYKLSGAKMRVEGGSHGHFSEGSQSYSGRN